MPSISENQRIQFQGREKHPYGPSWEEDGDFPQVENGENLLSQRQKAQVLKTWNIVIKLNISIEVIFLWKNEAVGKLDHLVEVLAAAFGVELQQVVVRSGVGGFAMVMGLFMVVLMFQAMLAKFRGLAEASQQGMGLGTIVELDVPIGGDQQHQQGDDNGSYFEHGFFHAAKIQNSSSTASFFDVNLKKLLFWGRNT